MTLPPLPEPFFNGIARGGFLSADAWIADQMRAYAEAAVLAERERWIGGVRVTIPTHAMEQEIAGHVRRAVAAERERCAKICESLLHEPDATLRNRLDRDDCLSDMTLEDAARTIREAP